MRYSKVTERIASEGAAAWGIHERAMTRQGKGEDVIILSVGDPDFDTPESIVNAAIHSLKGGDTHYTDCSGEYALRMLIAEKESARVDRYIEPEHVVVTAGAQNGLYSVAQCLLEAGDEVIIPDPMYITYEAAFTSTGAKIVNVPMDPDDHWSLDVNTIKQSITAKTRAIVINSPHNPTGSVVPREAWIALAELASMHDLWLIIDEVYALLDYSDTHFSPLSLSCIEDRVVSINSLSKSHAMTGWRLGWVVANPELATHLGNLALCNLYGSPGFIQQGALAAISDELSPKKMKAIYQERCDLLLSHISELDSVTAHKPDGGMFVMLDLRRLPISAERFANYLLDQYGVSVLVGDPFGQQSQGFVRLSLCVDNCELKEAASRITNCINELLKL